MLAGPLPWLNELANFTFQQTGDALRLHIIENASWRPTSKRVLAEMHVVRYVMILRFFGELVLKVPVIADSMLLGVQLSAGLANADARPAHVDRDHLAHLQPIYILSTV